VFKCYEISLDNSSEFEEIFSTRLRGPPSRNNNFSILKQYFFSGRH